MGAIGLSLARRVEAERPAVVRGAAAHLPIVAYLVRRQQAQGSSQWPPPHNRAPHTHGAH